MPDGSRVEQPKTDKQRSLNARLCAETLKIRIPMLVDNIDDFVGSAYQGFPDRLFIVGTDGKIAYSGARGPRGFKPAEMENALKDLLEKNAK